MDTIIRYERGRAKGMLPEPSIVGTYVLVNRTRGTVKAYRANGATVWPERKLDIGEEMGHLETGMWYLGVPAALRLPEGF